jgi:hypothetical protein
LLVLEVDEPINLDLILKRIDRLIDGHPSVLETSPGHYHIIQPVAEPLADLFMSE